jgi:hypothetical protein
MKTKKFVFKPVLNICVTTGLTLVELLLWGICPRVLIGTVLSLILLYASCKDVTIREADDWLSVMIVALAIGSISFDRIGSMVLGVAAVFFVISVFLWFKMHIRHEIIVLTGIGVKKEVARIEKMAKRETEEGLSDGSNVAPGARVLQNAGFMDSNITQNIGQMQTMPMKQSDYNADPSQNERKHETMPIGLMGSEETVLLEAEGSKSFDNNGSFVVEKDEVYITNNK